MRGKWKLIGLLALVAVLVGINVFHPFASKTTGRGAELRGEGVDAGYAIPDVTFDTVALAAESRVQAKDIERNIFEYGRAPVRSLSPQRTTQAPAPTAPPPPPPKPKPPLQFFGFAEGAAGSSQRVFLTDGEDIFVARQGELVMERFRVIQVNPESVQIQDTRGQLEWVLPLQQP
jgi:hypothetical protein